MVIPLHLGDNINDLQTRAKFGDVSKTKVKVLCESGAKLFKEAIVKRDLGDEESAYVLFFKYVDLIQKIRAHAEYKKDEKYFTSMYNIKKNLNKALEALETLSESLERRYSDKLKKETLKEIGDELSSKKAAKSAKSKVDFNSNENLTSTPISAVVSNGVAVQAEAKDYIITHKKLHSIISQKSTSFFILDTRSAEDYSNSHIKIPQSLNVSEQFLKPGTTAATIGKSLKIQERCQWERRTQQDMLIIADWTSEDFLPGTPVTVLRAALTECAEFPIKTRPYLLQGGYMKFMAWNPQPVTNHFVVTFGELDWKERKRRQRFWNKMLLEKRKLEGDRLEVERVEKEILEKQRLEEERQKRVRKEVVPECPLCLEEMGPGVAIWQCGAGHLVCGGCRGRARLCGECRQGGYTSRSRRLEQYRDKIMHILDIAPAQ